MKLLSFLKRDEKYLSWEEYKKRLVEMRVISLIDKLTKSNTNYSYNELDEVTKNEVARFSNL